MSSVVHILCAAVACASAFLLLRGYARGRSRLLLWSGLCFAGFTVTNILVLVDLTLLPHLDLFPVRNGVTLASLSMLIYGLVWDSR
jgi:hypothetical protein